MKEQILKELKILSEEEHIELTMGCFYQDELRDNYNKVIKAIAQTREETIREVEEEIESWEKEDGKSFTSDKIKNILNKLKK